MTKKEKRTRLKLIVNPSAGNSTDIKASVNSVTAFLKAHGYKVDVDWARPKTKATSLARKAVKDGYRVVAAMGGDGTVRAVMAGLTASKARLGIIPTGIQNNIARSLGVPLDLEQACRLISMDHVREMDVAQVKQGKGKWLPFFEMVGVGFASGVTPKEFAEGKPEDELFREQIAAEPEHRTIEPTAVLYLDDGQRLEIKTHLVTISNMPIFGKKFFVPPPEFLEDGKLDISVFQGFSEAELNGYYFKMKAGHYAGNEDIQHFETRRVKVKTFPAMDVIADGVELGKGTVSVRMRPGALRVLAAGDSRDLLGLPHHGYETQAASAHLVGAEENKISA